MEGEIKEENREKEENPPSRRQKERIFAAINKQIEEKNRKNEEKPPPRRKGKDLIEELQTGWLLPQLISIGPVHHGKESLRHMEQQKLKYTSAVVQNGNNSLEMYLTAVGELEDRARECYSDIDTIRFNSNEFVEMMVVDGCFIIVLLSKACGLFTIGESDPIFKLPYLLYTLKKDLLVLQNQIPFLVLQRLFDLMNITMGSGTLAELAIAFFRDSVPIKRGMMENPDQEVMHLLHLLYSNLLLETKEVKLKLNSEVLHIPCVTELHKCGIKFKKGEADSFLDIKFRKGVITIPRLIIENFTGSLLVNLIAFEQCRGNQIKAYVTFMGCLMNSAQDVEILRHNDIIDNWLCNDDMMVVDLFKTLRVKLETMDREEFYLSDVVKEVDCYCKSYVRFIIKYLFNPWTVSVLLPAIMVLSSYLPFNLWKILLTGIILAVLSYFLPFSPWKILLTAIVAAVLSYCLLSDLWIILLAGIFLTVFSPLRPFWGATWRATWDGSTRGPDQKIIKVGFAPIEYGLD